MPNKYYIRGRAFENWVKDQGQGLLAFGLRTAGSHGAFDVVLFEPAHNRIRFIQCKVYNDKKKSGLEVTKEKGYEELEKKPYVVKFERWTKRVRKSKRKSRTRTVSQGL